MLLEKFRDYIVNDVSKFKFWMMGDRSPRWRNSVTLFRIESWARATDGSSTQEFYSWWPYYGRQTTVSKLLNHLFCKPKGGSAPSDSDVRIASTVTATPTINPKKRKVQVIADSASSAGHPSKKRRSENLTTGRLTRS